MDSPKLDKISDAIANLYRASYYLARKSKKTGVLLLLKSKEILGKKLALDISEIVKDHTLKSPHDCFLWAERILDEYKRLRMNLLRVTPK